MKAADDTIAMMAVRLDEWPVDFCCLYEVLGKRAAKGFQRALRGVMKGA